MYGKNMRKLSGNRLAKYGYCLAALCVLAAAFICVILLRIRGSVAVMTSFTTQPQETYYFLQNDPAWADRKLGDSGFTMRSSGCLTSCIASALCMENIPVKSLGKMDPGRLNRLLSEQQVYDAEGNILWAPLENVLEVQVVRQTAEDVKADGLEMLLSQHIYPIVRVRVQGIGSFHYVLLTKCEDGKFWCMDPMNRDKEQVPLSDFKNRIYAVRYIVP